MLGIILTQGAIGNMLIGCIEIIVGWYLNNR